jgi:glycosyltransferase involved in cell wall biosynthesis
MKIVFDYQIFSGQKYGGISRYFAKMSSEFVKMEHDLKIFAPFHINEYLKKMDSSVVKGVNFEKFPYKTTRLLNFCNNAISEILTKKYPPDIFHETYYKGKGVDLPQNVNRVITVYDMIHEKFPEQFAENDTTKEIKRQAVLRADHVICISHSTKDDLCEIYDLNPNSISVVHLGHEFDAEAPHFNLPKLPKKPFLLYVGKREGYKNFNSLLEAVSSDRKLKAEVDIVAFGGGGFSKSEIEYIRNLGFSETNVMQIGGGDGVLKILYETAQMLVYPSLYEGFGIPPVEAMACNCAVVAANTSSIPEVIGDAGLYFDPRDFESQATAIKQVVFDSELRPDLIRKGLKRSKLFSWVKCAQETISVYDSIEGR